MNKKLPQISLDFGPEPEPSPNPPTEENGQAADHLTRQYMAAGVGVRIKSMKTPKAATGDPKAVTGDLFGDPGTEAAVPPAEPAPVPVAETTAITTEEKEAEPIIEPVESIPIESIPAEAPQPLVTSTEAPQPPITSREAPIPKIPRRKERVAAPAGATGTPKTAKSKRGRKSLKQVAAEADLIEIPADEVLFSKQYYTMGEVSEMFRVNQSLLRFWETEFDILQPRKNKKGDRYFRPVDIKNLHLIYHLLRQRKYTIEGAKEFLKKNKKGEERFEAIQRLQEIRAFLQEWKAQLSYPLSPK
jgi:DNA-binding transcriptional MerR regulator